MNGTRTGLACVVVLALLPACLQGQTVEDLRQRVDSMMARWNDVDDAARRAGSIRRASTPLDTIRQGPVTVLAVPEWSALVSEGLTFALEALTNVMQSDTSLLRAQSFFANVEAGPDRVGSGGGVMWRDLSRDIRWVTTKEEWGNREFARRLAQAVGRGFTQRLDDGFERWAQLIPVEGDVARMHRTTYIEMVTASSPVIRACFLGDLGACREGFFPEASDDPATRWFSADGRLQVVSEVNPGYLPELASVQASCSEDGVDASCIAFLRAMPTGTLGTPFSKPAIHGLIRVALEVGGDGAFGRFVEADSVAAEVRVLRTIQVSMDSLLGIWHTRVLAARPEPTIASPLALWGALASFVLLAGMALRSSRWR